MIEVLPEIKYANDIQVGMLFKHMDHDAIYKITGDYVGPIKTTTRHKFMVEAPSGAPQSSGLWCFDIVLTPGVWTFYTE